MVFIKKKPFYASKNTFFKKISSAAQLSSAFSDRLPAQLSSAQEKFSRAQLAQLSTIFSTAQLSSAQLFFSKFATLV